MRLFNYFFPDDGSIPALTTKQMRERGLLDFHDNDLAPLLEAGLQSTNQALIGRTPFTERSWKAFCTIWISSILHNASAPLFFMQFKAMEKLPLIYSTPLLFVIWAAAAATNSWVNYYQNIFRLTEEYGLALELKILQPKEPGTLYFFLTKNEHDEYELHYKILIENKKNEWVEEIGLLEKVGILEGLERALLDKLQKGRFDELATEDSIALKAKIAERYPHHKPGLRPDEFIPGTRSDAWFFLKCVLSESPAAFSGAILGYTITIGQSESLRIGAATLFAIMNWIKNIMTDMPIIAGAYGTDKQLGNMGPIIDQPGTWLVLNPLVIGFLKNIAPDLLAGLTAYGIATAKNIPFPVNGILALILFPFVASTFLIFTMYALQKLNVSKNNSISAMLGLNNSCAVETKPGLDRIRAIPGELFSWRALTISGFLEMGCSPSSVTNLLASAYAVGVVALVFDPTIEVAQNFLTFFFENSANSSIPYIAFALLILETFAAIMSARSKWSNFHECVKIRAQELRLENNQNKDATLVVCFAKGTSQELEFGDPHVLNESDKAVSMTDKNFTDSLQVDTQKNGVFMNYATLYGPAEMAGAQVIAVSSVNRKLFTGV